MPVTTLRAVNETIRKQVEHGLLTNYCFPSEVRLALVERLASLLPEPLKKIFLLTTGSETVECAIKLCRTYGAIVGNSRKTIIVSFENAFHGRTLGSQQAGGIPALKEWIGHLDPGFVQLSFPDGFRQTDTSFEAFERGLRDQSVEFDAVAGVILETYQGAETAFAPVDFMQNLRKWCDLHNALLVCDEVQAGFGRYRYVLGLRALRHGAGSGLLRKGNHRLTALGGGGGSLGCDGPAFSG